jgi:hypothetical protein
VLYPHDLSFNKSESDIPGGESFESFQHFLPMSSAGLYFADESVLVNPVTEEIQVWFTKSNKKGPDFRFELNWVRLDCEVDSFRESNIVELLYGYIVTQNCPLSAIFWAIVSGLMINPPTIHPAGGPLFLENENT